MRGDSTGSYPLPRDGSLAEVAEALRAAGHWAQIFDDRWNLVFVTDELRRTFGGGELADFAIGEHIFGPEAVTKSRQFRLGLTTEAVQRSLFAGLGGLILADTIGGATALRDIVDPILRDIVDDLRPAPHGALSIRGRATGLNGDVDICLMAVRVRDSTGRLSGTAVISTPGVGMATVGAMMVDSDPAHLKRMQLVARPDRRPAAILFADLEGSTALAQRLSTSQYFALGRRLVRAADQCIVDTGGLVGRHLGDGVGAFFLSEIAGSESAAARACVTAARSLRDEIDAVALSSGLAARDVVLRFGLHWGSTLYVGNITTRGRAEVTALGQEVNAAARIEACASGGRALASKDLIERLNAGDAAALGLGPDRLTYVALCDLETATEKARRDAPAIPVCEI